MTTLNYFQFLLNIKDNILVIVILVMELVVELVIKLLIKPVIKLVIKHALKAMAPFIVILGDDVLFFIIILKHIKHDLLNVVLLKFINLIIIVNFNVVIN